MDRFRNPFPQRPWMESSGAAAAATGASGLKGLFEHLDTLSFKILLRKTTGHLLQPARENIR